MTTQIQSISSIEEFMPHGMCLLWQPNLLFLHVISDAIITLSYYSIPIALVYFVVKRQDLSFRWLFLLFGLFILACGTTHLFAIWTIWHPDYFWEGLAKAVTAAVSLITAILLWPFIPIALKLPSHSALAHANALLQEEVIERQRYENQIKLLNRELEKKVEERTQSLHVTNRQLKQEIAERLQAERALRESKEQLKAIVETAADGIITIDQTGTIESINAAIERIFGYAKEKLIGQDVACLIPGLDQYRHADYVAKYIETGVKKMIGTRREAKGLHQNGHEFPLDISVTEFQQNGHYFFTAIIRDITDRKQAEEALRESQERLQMTLEAGSVGIFEVDVQTGTGFWNAFEFALLGIEASEAPQESEKFFSFIHADDRQEFMAVWEKALSNGNYSHEFRIVRADGEVRWLAGQGHFAFDSKHDGKPARFLGVNYDITERKRIEEALKSADHRKNEFLAMLGHELRNPLAPISAAADILNSPKLDEATLSWVREILGRNVAQISRLVDDLLDVSRITRGLVNVELKPVDLNSILRECAETIEPLIQSKQQKFDLRLPEMPLVIPGDRIRLAQVFGNLFNNAVKYSPEGSHIEATVTLERAAAQVDVKDNGMGIHPQLLPQIFDLFTQGERTLARSEGGLGIGLTLVKKLVELHSGKIEAYSDGVGQGSTFTVHLPLGAEAIDPKPALLPSTLTPTTQNPLRILLIDDNPDVVESLGMLLKLQHFTVKIALNGPQGIIEAEQFVPDIVVLDIGMPYMDGFEVACRLRALSSTQHVLLIALSGYAEDKDDPRAAAAGFDHYLLKPIDPTALRALIDQYKRIT